MAISLSKGGNVSLTKAAPGLRQVQVGLGWDPRTTTGLDFDLDASVIVCDSNGRCLSDQWFVFYGRLVAPSGAVVHHGDNLDGAGDGDDEVIDVILGMLPPEAARLVFVVSIHEADARGQNFGQVQGSFIRMVDANTRVEVARYDLAEDYSTETAMVFGELVRAGTEWQFQAIGVGYSGGLANVLGQFGINAG
jgi:tellurium resistance protein TerD